MAREFAIQRCEHEALPRAPTLPLHRRESWADTTSPRLDGKAAITCDGGVLRDDSNQASRGGSGPSQEMSWATHSGSRRVPSGSQAGRRLLLVPLSLQKLPLLVLTHLLAALLDDTTHSVFSLLGEKMRSGRMFRDSAASCQPHHKHGDGDEIGRLLPHGFALFVPSRSDSRQGAHHLITGRSKGAIDRMTAR